MKFLRKVRRGKWVKHPVSDWPDDSGLHCDALEDMRTKECNLSVYAILNVADRKRVAVALAATREEISVMDYAVFDGSGLKSLGITVRQTDGDTPDMDVNKLHYDLGDLTVKRLAHLTDIVSTGEHERIQRRDIKTSLCKAARDGRLNMSRIKFSKMRESLSKCA